MSCPPDLPNILGYGETFPHVEVDITYPNAKLSFPEPTGKLAGKPLYAVFLQGVTYTYVAIDADNSITFPDTLLGYTYILITTQSSGILEDDNTVAGPTILIFPYDSEGELIVDKVAVA